MCIDLLRDVTVFQSQDAAEPALRSHAVAGPRQQADRFEDRVRVIEHQIGWRALELAELWQYRTLLGALLIRDIKAAQKQTVLGLAWIMIPPLLAVATFTIVFGQLAGLPSDGVPYPLFVFAGQVLWGAFALALQATTTSVVMNSQFVQKVYFPRLVIPMNAALASVFNVAVVLAGLIAMLTWYGYTPTWRLLLTLPLIALVLATALGVGMLLAPVHVLYRDVAALTTVAVQMGFYLTPVVYPISLVPDRYYAILFLNPLAGYVGAFRWVLYGSELPLDLLIVSMGTTVIVLIAGAYYFVRMQGRFADMV